MSAYTRKDAAYREAKRTGYRSRAAIKLIDLDDRYRLLRPGARVLDLGCWPGGWLQVAAERVGATGKVVGVDLVATDPLLQAGVVLLEGDASDESVRERARQALGGAADVLLSDMAPKLSGIKPVDRERHLALVDIVIVSSGHLLAADGRAVVKLFSDVEKEAVQRLRTAFGSVIAHRPPSTRKGSSEIYVIAGGPKLG